jgi:hypothetical protein
MQQLSNELFNEAASIGDQILVRHLGGVKCSTIFSCSGFVHIDTVVFTTGHPWLKHVESVTAFGRFQVGTPPF